MTDMKTKEERYGREENNYTILSFGREGFSSIFALLESTQPLAAKH
jgi:hypothetical protein